MTGSTSDLGDALIKSGNGYSVGIAVTGLQTGCWGIEFCLIGLVVVFDFEVYRAGNSLISVTVMSPVVVRGVSVQSIVLNVASVVRLFSV